MPRGAVDPASGQRSGSGATDAVALTCLEVQLALLVPNIWGQGLPTPRALTCREVQLALLVLRGVRCTVWG